MTVEPVLRGNDHKGRHGYLLKTTLHPVTAELPYGLSQPDRLGCVKVAAINEVHLLIGFNINEEGSHIPLHKGHHRSVDIFYKPRK